MTDTEITFDGVVGGTRVVVATRQGTYACTAIKSDVPAFDRHDGWVGACNRFAAPDEIVGEGLRIVQVRPGVWVFASADSEGTLLGMTVSMDRGEALTFEPIKDGRVIVGSVEGRISCVEVTSSRYAKVQAWPPFDMSDDRDIDWSGCPPYSTN
jgi:hypothetical protein